MYVSVKRSRLKHKLDLEYGLISDINVIKDIVFGISETELSNHDATRLRFLKIQPDPKTRSLKNSIGRLLFRALKSGALITARDFIRKEQVLSLIEHGAELNSLMYEFHHPPSGHGDDYLTCMIIENLIIINLRETFEETIDETMRVKILVKCLTPLGVKFIAPRDVFQIVTT